MECTGLYVSCYTLISIARRYGVPLLLIVAYLGSMNDQRNNSVYAVSGTYVEPLLDALQIKTQILVNGERLEPPIFKTPFATCTRSSCPSRWCLPEISPDDPL